MSSVSQIYFNKKCDLVNLSDIQKLIDEQVIEDYTLDYKAISKNPQYGSYAKVISSFLNTNGGLLIIGVSERSKKYPDVITWGKISKETLVRNFFRNVDPWTSEISIKPIPNPEDETECIFVVDVPRSKNPPHMANGVYYYRNVFESIPMTHSQVKGIFTESYISKEKIVERIIEPIYRNITDVLEKKDSPELYYGDSGYSSITSNERYLYDQINQDLRNQIDHFFELVKLRDDTERELRDYYSDQMKRIILEFSNGAISREDIKNKVDLLEMSFEWSEGFRTRRNYPYLFDYILNDKNPFFEANENPIENVKAEIKGYKELTQDEFFDLFIKLKRQTRKSRLFSKWEKTNKNIEAVGEELVKSLRSY